MHSSLRARRICRSTGDFPFRVAKLPALIRTALIAGAVVATPGIAAEKHVSDWFPGLIWSLPTAWSPLGEPRGGDLIYIDRGPGIVYAPLTSIDETFESLTVNASTDTDRLLFLPSSGGPIPIPSPPDFPASVLLPAMHLQSNNVTLGDGGAGAIIQTGGFLTVNLDLRLGHADSGWGFYSITSPDFTSGAHIRRDAFIGAGGLGTVAMSNNQFSVDRDLTFGDLAGGMGAMQFAGALTVGRDEILGDAGTGRMIQGVGTHVVGNSFILGRESGGQGSFTGLPGSRLQVGKDLVVGAAGNGTMNFSGGEMRIGNDLIVAAAGGSSGTVHFDGPSFVDITRDFVVGDGGEGSGRKVLDLLSSIHVHRDLILGRNPGGSGRFEMLAGNMLVDRDVVVGNGGRGYFVIGAGSALVVEGNVTVGRSNVTVGLPPLSLPGLPDVSLPDLISNAASNAPSPSLGTTFGTLPDIGFSPDLEYTAFRTLSDGVRVDFPFVPANTMIVFAAGTAQIHGNLVVGAEGKGVFGHFAAGTVVVDGSLIVGQQGEGLYSAAGLANLVVKGDWIVGDAGKGLWAGGGTMVVQGDSIFGRQAGSRALLAYAAGGGTLLQEDLILGDHGNATLVQAGSGGFAVRGSVIVGRETDGVGDWDIAADQLSVTGDLVLGGRGRGTATMRQSTSISVKGSTVLGQSAGSRGVLDMRGTSFGAEGGMVVGAASEGTLRVRSGSSLIVGGTLTFGEIAGATGEGTFDIGSFLSVAGTLDVGVSGNGAVTFNTAQTAATPDFRIQSDVMFGRHEGVTGTGTLVGTKADAPALEIAGSMTLGVDGIGTFRQQGGHVGIGVDLTLGASGFGSGRYELDGNAALRIDRDLILGITGQAEFVQRGGDVTVAGSLAMARHGQPSSFQLLGGKLLAHEFWMNTNASFTAGLGRVSLDRASVFGGKLDLGVDADLVLQANPVAPVHRMGHLDLTGGIVKVGKLSILPDGSLHQDGGELDTQHIVFDHGTVTGELQSKRLFTVLGPEPALFGGRLRNEGRIELLADFEAADGVDNRATFDIAAGRTVKLMGRGLANHGEMTLRGDLLTSETVSSNSFRQYAGRHVTDNLRVEDRDGVQSVYSLVDGLLQVEQSATIGTSDAPGVFLQEGGNHRVGQILRVAGGGRYTMVDGSIVAGGLLNEGLFEVIGGRIDAPIDNAGRIEWRSEGDVTGTGSLTNLRSGTFNASAAGSFALAIENRGQWTKDGAGLQTYTGAVTQDGSLLVNAGTLRMTGGATGEGNTGIATGATMEFAGGATYAFSRQFNNNGRVLVDPASVTFSGAGMHTGRFSVAGDGTLAFAGTSWSFNGTGAGIEGTGRMRFLSGLTTFGNGSTFTHTGPLDLLGGSVRFLAGSAMTLPEDFVIQGTSLDLSTGTAQSYGRNITMTAGGFGGADPFTLTAGVFDWRGGTLFGPAALTLRDGTELRISGPDHKGLEREVVVEGKALWNSGDVLGSGLLRVAEGGIFTAFTGGSFQADILAQGRFEVVAPGAVAHFSGGFTAESAVRIREGTLRVSGTGASTAAIAVEAGGVAEFAGGSFDFHGNGARLSGPGQALFSGGTVVFRDGATFGAMGSERIAGGTLEFRAGSRYTFNPVLAVESGSLLMNTGGTFVVPRTTQLQSGLLGGDDAKHVTAGSVFSWSGGSIAGGGISVLSGGRMEMIPGGAKVLETGVTNAGVIAWTGSDVAGPGSFTNLADGTFEISGSGSLSPSLANAGRLVMDGSNENAVLRGAFSNSGSVEVNTGTLQVLGPFSNLAGGTLSGGTYVLRGTLYHARENTRTIAADVTLAGTGAFFRSGTSQSLIDTLDTVAAGGRFTVSEGRDFTMATRPLTVEGEFRVGNGSTFSAQASNLGGSGVMRVLDGGLFVWTGATLNSRGTLQVDDGGVLRISGGNDHDMDRRTLQNAGKVEWQAGTIRGGNAGRIDNRGLWIDATTGTADINRAYGGGAGEVYNGGVWRKTGDGTTRIFSQEFNNAGTVELQAGVFELHGGGTTSAGGRFEIAEGATLGLRNSYRFAGDTVVSGAGRAEATGGVLTLENAVAFSQLALAGNATLAGTHQFSGHLLWTTGNMNGAGMTTIVHGAQLTIAGANDHDLDRRTLFNGGTVEWEGGNVRGGNGTIIVNKGLWLDRIAANAAFNRAYGGSDDEWLNIGTYRKSTNTITTFAHTLRNHGVFEVDAGTLRLSGGTTHATGARIEVASGAVMEMHGTQTFQDGVTLDGPAKMFGTVVVTGKLTASDFEIVGGTLAGTHTLHGSYRWSGGNLNNAGTTTIAAGTVFTLADTGNHDLDRRTFINDGTVDWQGGNVRGGNASSIVNNGLWLDRIAGNAGFGRDYGGADGEWVNNGTYRKSTDTITTFSHALRNRGVIEVNDGTLRLSAGTTHEGGSRIAVAGGALLEMYATQTFQDGVRLDGLTRLYGAAVVTGNLTASNFEITGGTLSGDHTLHGNYRWNSGNFNASGLTVIGSDAVLTITAGGNHDLDRRLFVNRGEIRWESGAIRGGNGSVIENAALWHDQTTGVSEINRAYGGGGGRFLNAGTYLKTGSGVTRILQQPFDNTGVVSIEAGTLALHGGGTMGGASHIGIGENAVLGVHSFVTFADGFAVTGPGRVLVTNGVANVQGAVSFSHLVIGSSGQLAGTHVLSGDILWTEGTWNGAGTTTIASGALLTITGGNTHDLDRRTLVNDGTVAWEGGNVRGGNKSSIVNNALWLDRLAGNAAFNREYGGDDGEWVNNGTYRKTTNTTTNLAHTLRNSGVFEVDAGTLRLSGSTTHTTGSRVEVAGGVELEMIGTQTFEDGVTLDGRARMLGAVVVTGGLTASDFEIAGGTFNGTHTLRGNYRWTAGNLNNAGTTTIAAAALFTLADTGNHDLDRRTLINDGKVVWEGGNVRGGNGTSIINNGLWLDGITADAQFNRAYGGGDGEWVNNGTYRKTTNTVTTFAHTLRNRGEFDIDAGTLRMAGGTTHETGSRITVASGALLEIHSSHTFQSGVTLDGPTRLIGTAVVTGDLQASDLEIAGGVLAGDHTLHGSYRWSSGNLNSAGLTVLAGDAVLTIATGSDHDMDRRVLVNRGEVRWQAGAIRTGNAGRIENARLWLDETRGTTEINRAYGGGGGDFLNSGSYRKTGDGVTRISQQAFDNPGELHVEAGRMELNGGVAQIQGNRLTGGTWHAGPNATIAVAGNPLVTVNEGNVWLQGVGSVFTPIDGIAENRGSFRLSGGRRFTTQGAFTNTGNLVVGVGSALIVPGRLTLGGSVWGNGVIRAESTLVRGRLRPGASPGELSIEGDVELDDAASLEIEIAGMVPGIEHDVVRVSGIATLGGALEVSLLQSFAGLETASFTFLTAQSVVGTFDGIADGDRIFTVDGSGSFLVDYTSDAVLLTSFQTAPVPEPQTWMLLGAGLALLGAVKRRMGLRR